MKNLKHKCNALPVMNLELDEEYGAGFEGTKGLLYKYIQDTPGQSIQQYMKTKSLSEILKKSDPVEDWIRDFIDSDDARFAGKTKKERINMALGAYYAAQRNESIEEGNTKTDNKKMTYTAQVRQANKDDRAKRADAWRKVFSNLRKEEDEIEEGNTKTYAYSTVIAKLKDGSWETSYDVKQGKHLEVTDNSTKKRLTIFVEETISEEKLSATQISALRQEYSKISKVDPSGEGYKKLTALLDKLDKQSLQDLVDAKIKFVSSLALNRISQKEEDETELEESTVSASQIDRYIDTENWKAIADLLKGLTDDEHELWAKNGYDGRTYELMMKSRERSKSYKDAVEKMKNTLGVNESAEIDSIIKQFIDSGRVAVRYPKKKTISVSGVNMPEKDAVEKMKRILSIKESKLNEAQNLVSKGIYTLDGKKIEGARSSKLFLQALDSDGFLHNLSWKEWSESNLKDTSSDYAKQQFIDRLAKQIKMFNKRIDLNTWLKGGDRSFTDTVNYIFKLDPNIKYSKTTALKEETNLKETPSLETLRMMKIVSLATGCTDSDALYEYALTSPSYSSIVELKENFNKYIQDA